MPLHSSGSCTTHKASAPDACDARARADAAAVQCNAGAAAEKHVPLCCSCYKFRPSPGAAVNGSGGGCPSCVSFRFSIDRFSFAPGLPGHSPSQGGPIAHQLLPETRVTAVLNHFSKYQFCRMCVRITWGCLLGDAHAVPDARLFVVCRHDVVICS